MGIPSKTAIPVAQGARTKRGNAINKTHLVKLVRVVFHTDRYQGRCWLFPLENAGTKRLQAATKTPTGSQQTTAGDPLYCRSSNPAIMGFSTTQIKAGKGYWTCFVKDPLLPMGKYILEVPLKKRLWSGKGPKSIFHLVEITGKMVARTPYELKLLGTPPAGVLPKPVIVDSLIGDGMSLEEALFNLAAYRYEASIGGLRKADMAAVAGGDPPESGFKTALGVAQSAQEHLTSLIGIINADFGFYNDLKKLDQYFGQDQDRLGQGLITLWKKTGIAQSQLDWVQNLTRPNTAGMLIYELDENGKQVRKLSTLESLEENKLAPYRLNLQYNKPYQTFQDYVRFSGSVMAFLGNVIDTVDMWAAFQAAEAANVQFQRAIGDVVRARTQIDRGQKDLRSLWEAQKTGWFCRGDLTNIETLKANADNLAAKAAVTGWKWTFKMSSQAIGFCSLGKVFADTKLQKAADLYPMVKSVAATLDSKVGKDVIARTYKDIETWWHDVAACASNDVTLKNALFAYGGQQSQRIKILFLLRAKVLYGLKRLIDKCGPAVDSEKKRSVVSRANYAREAIDWLLVDKSFHDKIRLFRIESYINTFCLSPHFFVRKDHLLEDWVHHWVEEWDDAYRNQVIKTSVSQTEWRSGNWRKVDFQKYWPIHFMDHPNVAKFATQFATDWSEVSDGDIARCILLRGTGQWKQLLGSKKWTLKITQWHRLKDEEVIDSETPVRVVLIFKAAATVALGTPVQFQLERTDGANVTGPLYNAVARPFHADSPEGKEMRSCGIPNGRYIAVADLTYGYRDKKAPHEAAKIYHGLKPMLETSKWYDWVAPWGFHKRLRQKAHAMKPFAMSFAVKYAAGDGSASGYASLKNFWNSTVEITVVPERVSAPKHPADPYFVKFNARNRKKFTDIAFLQRQVPSAKPAVPQKPALETVVAQYSKDGKRWHKLADRLNWNHHLRVIFVFKKKVTWAPCVIRIDRVDCTWNVKGPHYTSNVVTKLDHVGFRGKWGVIITPYYYFFKFRNESGHVVIEELNDNGKPWRGVKPFLCAKRSTDRITENDYRGFEFDILYDVGTNDPKKASTRVPNANDVKLLVKKQSPWLVWGLGVGEQIGLTNDTISSWPENRDFRTGHLIALVGEGVAKNVAIETLRNKKRNMYDIATTSY